MLIAKSNLHFALQVTPSSTTL